MKLRVARHTNELKTVTDFYKSVLGFEMLGEFKNHAAYNGIFLGLPGVDWHLEFTTSNEKANHHFDDDDILVFYPKNKVQYEKIIEKIISLNIELQEPKNPYWKKNGTLIKDPDGFLIIIVKISQYEI